MIELENIIESALNSSRVKAAASLRGGDMEKFAYTSLAVLEDCFGKEKPEQESEHRYTYWKSNIALVNICANIGRLLLVGTEEPKETKPRNLERVRLGFVIIDSLIEANLFDWHRTTVEEGKKSRDKYFLKVKRDSEDTVVDLLSLVDKPGGDVCIYVRPQFEKPMPFIRFMNPEAGELVRNSNPEARQFFKKDRCPKVFDVINSHMSVAYNINTELLDIYKQCQDDAIFTFENKIDLDQTQLQGLERERDKVLEIAEWVGDKTFWEYMFYDSRGRLYSSAVYLTHAGSKLSKSLFLYDKKKALGSEGYFWLLVHAANCRGWDKLTIDERFNKAEHNFDAWKKIARDPVKNKQWQCADSPYEFLAAITEIFNSHNNPGGVYEYESGLPVAWDATCSGLQVLSALSRDEVSGALCNLTDTDKRGDYYKFIADHVWKDCVYTDEEEAMFKTVTEEMTSIDRKIKVALKSKNKEKINEAFEGKKAYLKNNRSRVMDSAKVYWGKLYSKRRSICKRPCMTYFYSCQEKTMAKAMLKDHSSDKVFAGLNYHYAKWLADKIYDACRTKMDKPTSLMDLFIEMGVEAYKEELDFALDAPVTNFKMMQYYRIEETCPAQLYCKSGKKIKLRVSVGSDKLNKDKIASATSPNVVHMLDSQIVAGVLLKADYQVSCIHDSFSTHAADAGKLYQNCRDVFVEIFERDILEELVPGANTKVAYGCLDINEVYDNDYNFS